MHIEVLAEVTPAGPSSSVASKCHVSHSTMCRRQAFLAQVTDRYQFANRSGSGTLSTNFNLTLLHGDSFLDGESDGACVLVKLHSPGISQRGQDHGLVEVNKKASPKANEKHSLSITVPLTNFSTSTGERLVR